jgi:hypothetical protein
MTLYEDDMSHFPSKLLLSLAFCWTGEKEKTMKEICVMWTPCLRSSHPTLATGRPQELGSYKIIALVASVAGVMTRRPAS